MKTICASIMTTVVGLAAGCLLGGCAQNTSKKAVYEPIEPTRSAPEIQVIGTNTNLPPLAYQWFSTNGSPATATFTVTTTGAPTLMWSPNTNRNEGPPSVQVIRGTNGPFYYQWNSNTNGNATAPFPVQAVNGTNGALYYQWYKNTNSP